MMRHSCIKNGLLYIANDNITPNTSFLEGTSGATWTLVSAGAPADLTLGILASNSSAYSGTAPVSLIEEYRAPFAGTIKEYTYGCSANNGSNIQTGLFAFDGSTNKPLRGSSTENVTMASTDRKTITLSTALTVNAGDYVGLFAYNGGGGGTSATGFASAPAGTSTNYYSAPAGIPDPSLTMTRVASSGACASFTFKLKRS